MWRKGFGFTVLTACLVFIGILSLLNYSASFALISGIILAGIAIWLSQFVIGWNRTKSIIQFLVTYAVLLFLIWLAYMKLFPVVYLSIGTVPGVLEDYQAVIKPSDEKLISFIVQESGTLDSYQFLFQSSQPANFDLDSSQPIRFQERLIQSHKRGFLLREVSLQPLNVDDVGKVNITLADGSSFQGDLCGYFYEFFSTHPDIFIPQCPSTRIELVDFPKDSFYAAKNATNIENFVYIDTESVRWSVWHLDQGIKFSYIPPPFYHLRALLSPFIGISFWSQWVFVIIGMISTFIATSILKPTIVNLINDKFKSRIEKRIGGKPKTKVKLIISGRGEEKEIEIEQDES